MSPISYVVGDATAPQGDGTKIIAMRERVTLYSDRDAWLAARGADPTSIGASEVAAVLGASPHKGPWEVWTAKRAGIAIDIDEITPDEEDADSAPNPFSSYTQRDRDAINVVRHPRIPRSRRAAPRRLRVRRTLPGDDGAVQRVGRRVACPQRGRQRCRPVSPHEAARRVCVISAALTRVGAVPPAITTEEPTMTPIVSTDARASARRIPISTWGRLGLGDMIVVVRDGELSVDAAVRSIARRHHMTCCAGPRIDSWDADCRIYQATYGVPLSRRYGGGYSVCGDVWIRVPIGGGG